jgi:hypothetical protein
MSYSEFHCLLSEKRPDDNVVAYPPMIDARPTDMSTVPTTMKKCLDMSMDVGQEHAITSESTNKSRSPPSAHCLHNAKINVKRI